MQTLNNEPKPHEDMERETKDWVARCDNFSNLDFDECIDFQTDFVADLCAVTGYNSDVTKARNMFHRCEHDQYVDIITHKEKCFTSTFTGSKASLPAVPWFRNFDDSKESFVTNCKVTAKQKKSTKNNQ